MGQILDIHTYMEKHPYVGQVTQKIRKPTKLRCREDTPILLVVKSKFSERFGYSLAWPSRTIEFLVFPSITNILFSDC